MEGGQGTDAWTTLGEDVMKEIKWGSRHKVLKKSWKRNSGGEVKPPRRGPDSLLSPIDSLPTLLSLPFALLLLCSPPFSLTCCVSVSPSLTLSSTPASFSLSVLLLHPLPTRPSPSLFFFPLTSHTVTPESIQDGLCYAASLSSLTNTSVQRIKGRICWLCHKPFPWLLITKWSWLLTTEAEKKQKTWRVQN